MVAGWTADQEIKQSSLHMGRVSSKCVGGQFKMILLCKLWLVYIRTPFHKSATMFILRRLVMKALAYTQTFTIRVTIL